MNSFGVKSAYGNLKRVLMHRPGRELDRVTGTTLEDFHFKRPVDREAFLADYDAMLSLFHEHGVETLLLTDVLKHDDDALRYIELRPNVTYTRDLAAVFASGAVLMSPFLRGRWWDQWVMGRAFERLGIPILGGIEAPGFLEGGGVTMIGEDTAVASLCDRATEDGLRTLRELVLGKDVKYFLEVPLPSGHIHIDGLFMTLDEKLALVHEKSLDVFPCRLYEAGKAQPSYPMFLEFLSQRGVEILPITDEERIAGHLNVVVTQKSRKAIGFEQAIRVGGEMSRHGWQLDTFPSEELFIGNGGAHCMTCPVLVS